MTAVASLDTRLRTAFVQTHPYDAARSLESLSDTDLGTALESLPGEALVGTLERLVDSRAHAVFARLDPEQRKAVLEHASPRLASLLMDALDDETQAALLEALPKSTAREIVRLQRFDADSAARLMERPYDTIRADMTVVQALDVLRRSGLKRTRSVYVVDRDKRLVGRADMQAMAIAEHDQVLKDLLAPIEGVVTVTAPRREIVELLEKYRIDSLPVIDVEGHLVGIVRHQSLFDAVEAEAISGLQTMVGASADERALSPAMFAVKRRLPWLHINLLTAFLAAAVVGAFESLIAQFTALAVLLPVVAGQSGNAGSQALAVTMRGLALREIGLREWRRVLTKEVRIGLVDGLALALTCGAAVFWWSSSIGLAVVIAVAMVLSMVAAGISGALVPMILTRVGQDPATASSIILTTVTDVAGFISFLGTATLLSFML
jgi:magnesium transporter